VRGTCEREESDWCGLPEVAPPSKPALLKTLVFRCRLLWFSSSLRARFRFQQQKPTKIPASITSAATMTATVIATMLPVDILDLEVDKLLELLLPVG